MTDATKAASDAIVADNIGLAKLVVSRWKRLLPPPRDEDGLYGECCLGLVRAARQYDPARGAMFSTFAVRVMEQLAIKFIRSERRRGMRGVTRTHEAAAVLPEADLVDFSLDYTPGRETREEWGDDEWAAVLAPLDDRTRAVITARYRHGMSLIEVATEMGITLQRVDQLAKRGFHVIRDRLADRN